MFEFVDFWLNTEDAQVKCFTFGVSEMEIKLHVKCYGPSGMLGFLTGCSGSYSHLT
jgi:hypothetical protein